jgi:hypothetical protein
MADVHEFRGLCFGVLFGVALWVALIGSVYVVCVVAG